jgi:hypothetical protein
MSTTFDDEMSKHQVRWRKAAGLQVSENGTQNGVERPWILPRVDWEDGLYPGIRKSSATSLAAYIAGKVQPHAGVHNLKSSWVLCANLYFPFGATGAGRSLLAAFLRKHLDSSIATVDRLELEYEDEGDLKPGPLLGELGGGRGSGQTSPDLAFVVNGGTGLVLVESKFVEHSFYRCSALRTADKGDRLGNRDPSRCVNVMSVLSDPAGQCHQAAWGRRYWEILEPVASREAMLQLTRCPAMTGGYQLLRQQALAEGIAGSGKYELVVSAVAWDERNATIRESLRGTGLQHFEGWGALFSGRAKFGTFTHQAWVKWVSDSAQAHNWSDWLAYVRGRYALQ